MMMVSVNLSDLRTAMKIGMVITVNFNQKWEEEISIENELYKMNSAKLKMGSTDVHFDNEVLTTCALLT